MADRLVTLTIIAAVFSIAGDVEAEEADLRRTARARALYSEGVTHADAERWDEAADRFGRALALHPSPATAYNFAYALDHLGRLVEAREALARYVLRESDASESMVAAARQLDERLAERVGTLILSLTGETDEAVVRVDGRVHAAELIEVETPIDPGEHLVEVRRGSETIASTEVVIEEGGQAEVTLDLPPPVDDDSEEVEDVGPSTPPPATPVVRRWWFWTIIGVAVVATSVGLGVGLGVDPEAEPVSGTFDPGLVEIGR